MAVNRVGSTESGAPFHLFFSISCVSFLTILSILHDSSGCLLDKWRKDILRGNSSTESISLTFEVDCAERWISDSFGVVPTLNEFS